MVFFPLIHCKKFEMAFVTKVRPYYSQKENQQLLTNSYKNLGDYIWCTKLRYYGKCLTYVAKTRANLTTYSRKPENYNGTIIFEIDIMKNSSPINLNLCQT